jgi:hypothetical protein
MAEPKAVNLFALSDLATPWCLRVAATLRIADRLASGDNGVEELAVASACNADWLHRVLRHLAANGVFEEAAPGRFALNEAARELLDPGMRLMLDLDGLGGRLAHPWSTLLEVVRTGRPAYHELFGRSFWEDLEAHPTIAAEFDSLMGHAGHGTPDTELSLEGGWESVRSVVDVGGGTGAMLAEILRSRPWLRGTLVDLPRTIARAAENFEAAGVLDRVSIVGQSFFDPLPAGADLYLLKKVLNDWPDHETLAILRRCAEAARPNGRVVVIGGVVPDDEALIQSLAVEMVLIGGKSNTLAEFRDLARQAGLEVTAAGHQPSGSFMVECRPA